MEEARVACHTTFDFGIASIFIQGNRFYVRDQSIVIVELNYVGFFGRNISYSAMNHIIF